MRAAVLATLAACTPLATSGSTGPRSIAAPPTEQAIKERSHQLLAAFDRGDIAALAPQLAPGFVHFEGGTPRTRDTELAALAKRSPGEPHIGTRTWSQEYVYIHPDDAVFVGDALEHVAGNAVHAGYVFDGWYTLEWKRDGDAWRLALWTWQRAGAGAERDTWNDIFRTGSGFNPRPNQLLVDTVAGVRPGRALDVAMGQGRNALYLASQGWLVTGVDFSAEGIRIAREHAAKAGLALDAEYADLASYDFGTDKWDLVTMIYAGDDVSWIERIKPSLRPGGLFVVEYFHDNDTPGKTDGSFARGELAKLFGDGFEIVRDEVVDAVPDWAKDRASLVRFVARKK
ncbi:MAG TPA: methyltransferase domain-containing protein [Kofleriaceae bacterium]|nr:methyltransferase domain-containing protein [Kofleriaceae bacterium]